MKPLMISTNLTMMILTMIDLGQKKITISGIKLVMSYALSTLNN